MHAYSCVIVKILKSGEVSDTIKLKLLTASGELCTQTPAPRDSILAQSLSPHLATCSTTDINITIGFIQKDCLHVQ